MHTTQIGAQLYTLRDYCKTPGDISRTLKRLKDIGYGVVQTSALGSIAVEELKKILDDNGLICAATHCSLDEMKDVEKCLAYHQVLDCKLTALGGFSSQEQTPAPWHDFAREFNEAGKTLAERGLRVGYHNHSHELAPFGAPSRNAGTPLQLLIDELDTSIWFEIDTYWIVHGGGDPAAWIHKCKGRLPALHVKDMTIDNTRQQKMCEVGSGNLHWPAILNACRQAGVQWYLVERDEGDLDPFESLKVSLENMQAMGLS